MKVCIFGSSFNPPHNAHLEIVKGLQAMNFDRLLIVPTGNPNHKKIEISDEDRIKLVTAFCHLANVEYSLHEIENEFEYTLQSIDYLNFDQADQIFFAIGSDSLNNLRSWDYYEKLRMRLNFVIINRPGLELDQSILDEINYQILDVNTSDISSTQLRNNISEQYIPSPVFKLIKKLGLYSQESDV